MAKNTAIYERFREKGSRHCYQSRQSGNMENGKSCKLCHAALRDVIYHGVHAVHSQLLSKALTVVVWLET